MEAMADTHVERKKKNKKISGSQYCVAGGSNNFSCKNHTKAPGISMHPFPKKDKVTTKWIDFVKTHRVGWESSIYSTMCSVHFRAKGFAHPTGSPFTRTFKSTKKLHFLLIVGIL